MSPQSNKKRPRGCVVIMWAAIGEDFYEFLNMSSLHGVKFITNRKNFAERLLWLLVCGAAVLGTVLMASIIWTNFRTSPTLTIVEDPSFPIWNLDFPALTVCNLNKVQLSRAKELGKRLLGEVDNATQAVFLDSLLALGLMRYPYYHHPQIFVRRGSKKLMDFSQQNITLMMLEVMPKQADIFGTCYWKGREIPCDVAFHLQLTEEGFCYSFNSKTSQLPNSTEVESPPFVDSQGNKQAWRNNAAGKTTGLEVFFKSAEHEYLPSDERIPGFNLIVHHPSEYPEVSRAVFLPRTVRQVAQLAVTTSRVHGSPSLSRLSRSERGCRLVVSDELEVQANCQAQCRLDAIVKNCMCVPYFAVSRVATGTPQCTIDHIGCLFAYNAQQRNIRPPNGSIGFRRSDLRSAIDCDCPPSCSSTVFKTELLFTHRTDPFPFDDYAYLDFFFKDLEAVSYIRDVKFGVLDLIVSFGGMAGLFLGFSLISAVEMIYYLLRFLRRLVCGVIKKPQGKNHHPAVIKVTPIKITHKQPLAWDHYFP